MTPSQQAKSMGLKSLKQVAEMIDKPVSILHRWHSDNPALFNIVLLGCVAHLQANK